MIGAAPLTGAEYGAGSAALLGVVALLAWGAWEVRRALLPDWSAGPARLAEAIIVLAVAVGLAQVLGTFGAFRRAPVLVAGLALGTVMVVAGRRYSRGRPPPVRAAAPAPTPVEELVAVIVVLAFVAAQWATHVADALRRGMIHADTLWYHAPYAAEIVRTGHTFALFDRSDVLQAYYPMGSAVVHALVELPYDRDFLAPFVNIGWAALALLAAWCIGRRRGVAALSLLGAVAVLSLPMLAATQPGQASDDVAVSALLLTAAALLLESDLAPAPAALAGVAAGLAIGTKFTALIPVGVLVVGVVVLALRARRLATAVACAAAVAVFGSYWYVRNWAKADNPLPYLRLHLGPLQLPRRVADTGPSLLRNLGSGENWRVLYLPGFWQALGRAWPLVLAVLLTGGIVLLARSRPAIERVIGATILAGFVGYLVTPTTGALNFVFNVRYVTPVLLMAFVFVPTALEHAGRAWRRAWWIAMAGLVALDATSPHREGVAAWPADERAVAVITGIGVAAVAAGLVTVYRAPPRRRRAVILAGLGAVAAVLVVVGWPVQRRFLEHRYVDAGLPVDGIDAYFRGVHDSDVIVFGSVENYPLMGVDLSNRVRLGEGPTTRPNVDPCTQWHDVFAGTYRYVVLTHLGLVGAARPPLDWFTDDPAAHEVVRDGTSVAYRLDGPLTGHGCRG